MTIYLNGEYVQQDEAACAVSFTGGVFETMRAYEGRIFKLTEHIKRLFMSAKFLGINIPYTGEELAGTCCRVLKHAGLKEAQVRVSIRDARENSEFRIQNSECRNTSASGATAPTSSSDTLQAGKLHNNPLDLLIIVRHLPQISPENGVVVITSSVTKQPPLPQAKSSDFLPGVIARAEACIDNPFEVVLLNRHGYVTEGTVSNIFMVKSGMIITPPPYLGLLNGITRQCVFEIAQQTGLEIREIPFTRYDLFTADEIFLTNSTIEMLPVSVVDGRRVENRGDATRTLQEGYRQMVMRDVGIQNTGVRIQNSE